MIKFDPNNEHIKAMLEALAAEDANAEDAQRVCDQSCKDLDLAESAFMALLSAHVVQQLYEQVFRDIPAGVVHWSRVLTHLDHLKLLQIIGRAGQDRLMSDESMGQVTN